MATLNNEATLEPLALVDQGIADLCAELGVTKEVLIGAVEEEKAMAAKDPLGGAWVKQEDVQKHFDKAADATAYAAYALQGFGMQGNIHNPPSQADDTKFCWMEPQIKCPNCKSTINGLADAIHKDNKKFNQGATSPLSGPESNVADLIVYRVSACGCQVSTEWAAEYAKEINRRREGKKPQEVTPFTPEQTELLKQKLIKNITALWIFRDKCLEEQTPWGHTAAAKTEKKLLTRIDKYMRLCPGDHNKLPGGAISQTAVKWAQSKGMILPQNYIIGAQTITTIEQAKAALLNGHQVTYGTTTVKELTDAAGIDWAKEHAAMAEEYKQAEQAKKYTPSPAVPPKQTPHAMSQVGKDHLLGLWEKEGYLKEPVNPSQIAPMVGQAPLTQPPTPVSPHPHPNPGQTLPEGVPSPLSHPSGQVPQPSGPAQPLYELGTPEPTQKGEMSSVKGFMSALLGVPHKPKPVQKTGKVGGPFPKAIEPGKTTLMSFRQHTTKPELQVGDIYKVGEIVFGIVRDVNFHYNGATGQSYCDYVIAMTQEAPKCLVATGAVALQFSADKMEGQAYRIGDAYKVEGKVVGVVIGVNPQPAHCYYAVSMLPEYHACPTGAKTGGSTALLQSKVKSMDIVGVHVPLPPGVVRRRMDPSLDFTERPKRRIAKKRRKKPSSED